MATKNNAPYFEPVQIMNNHVEERLRQLIDDLKNHPLPALNESALMQVRALLEQYYRYIPFSELRKETPRDLIGSVLAHWQLLKDRRTHEPMVRVYNPNFEEHGWQSPHTIVEVVADDMAFLVDSLSMALNRAGLTIFLTLHPVVSTNRDDQGRLLLVHDGSTGQGRRESVIKFQVEKQLSGDVLLAIDRQVKDVLRDVWRANQDWKAMKQQVHMLREDLLGRELPVDKNVLLETAEFLQWMEQDHFTFLAYCELEQSKKGPRVRAGSGLGLLRDVRGTADAMEKIIPVAHQPDSGQGGYLVVTKANRKSTIHRPAYMDYVGIKRYSQDGKIDGEFCILGLFSSTAYSHPPRTIPLLSRKVKEVLDGAQLLPNSHSGKVLLNILDTFPRDALFQISSDDLLEISLGILGLQERQRTRIFVFGDTFGRFYSCLVYIPRERYSRELRIRVQKVLVEAFSGTEVEFSAQFSESILARMHFIVHTTTAGAAHGLDRDELERRIVEASQTWQDDLKEALIEQYGEAKAASYLRKYGESFPGGFREDFSPTTAAADIERIEQTCASGELGMHLYRPILEPDHNVHFRLYSPSRPVSLSDAIPILENMGLTVTGEQPYRVRQQSADVWIHDFSMRYPKCGQDLSERLIGLFHQAFLKIWNGDTNNDRFNQLVLGAGLSWRQVAMLRAYGRYMQQIRSPYSQDYITDSLGNNPQITAAIVDLFQARFSPDAGQSDTQQKQLLSRIEEQLDSVGSLDQDRIIRSYVNVISATLRTNYYQTDATGAFKPYLSFKIDARKVNGMPLPRPLFEVYVYSPTVEGIHLRGGRVARGGLRWSDRMDDYRTEVLGLMKAQMVKNTVIVPVGSKGGFVLKKNIAELSREQQMAEVIGCYQTFLRGLLDITDNYQGGGIVPPDNLVRYDEDDPYLVIAADKGTAAFSDIANGVAAEYGFWLGDAFASGGSSGYDHKKMAITARGAWESVSRSFRELGVDIQSTDFRVVGIGDMAGDVFGNGMLLSRHIKLVGAFNHRHIFLDPDPDPELSFQERQRLFQLPGSSWDDYQRKLISDGGGIYQRSAKSVTLTEPVKVLLGVKDNRLPPNELIHQLLKAPVDLLWNGGIGTYVKATSESHEEVRDKANDSLRVNGAELRCKVVGEGGNLGLTQLGRVEFALKGGLLYTDFIDNSAGVDCSDHEVNIKILLDQVVAAGDMTLKQRNSLLAEMTGEVAELVLADNYAQTQAISMIASEAPRRLNEHARFISWLEQQGRLNRTLEFLPEPKAIAERQLNNAGLTKPEIAILLSYSKMTYYEALILSSIPDDEYLDSELGNYFPQAIGTRFSNEMRQHRLKREIIATHLTNSIVDHIGPGFGFRMREEVGANIAGVTRAYLSVTRIFDTDELWRQLETMDNQVSASIQIEMMLFVSRMLERAVNWMLRYRSNVTAIRQVVDYFRPSVIELAESMPKPLAAPDRLDLNRRIKYLVGAGVPRDIARRTSAMVPLASALDIVEVARQSDNAVGLVASLYFHLGNELELEWLRMQISGLEVRTHWHNLANIGLANMLNAHQRELAAHILETARVSGSARRMIAQWSTANAFLVERHKRMINELKTHGSVDFAMLSVVINDVGGLLIAGRGCNEKSLS